MTEGKHFHLASKVCERVAQEIQNNKLQAINDTG
jgi:hypothetical protein